MVCDKHRPHPQLMLIPGVQQYFVCPVESCWGLVRGSGVMDLLLDMDPGCNGSTVCHGSTACNGSCHGSCHRSTACNGSTSGWFQAGFAQDTSLDCGTTRKDLPHPTPLSHLMSLSLMTSMTGQATLVRCRRTLSSSGSSHPTLHSTCESRNVRTSPVHRWGRTRPQTLPPAPAQRLPGHLVGSGCC